MPYEMTSALPKVKTIKLLVWFHENVRNSAMAGAISSKNSMALARGLDFVRIRNRECL